jgi:hypothetical protein
MKELKAAIEIAGMTHADCLEKSDLLKRYKEAQDKRTNESWHRGFEGPSPSTASANNPKPSIKQRHAITAELLQKSC